MPKLLRIFALLCVALTLVNCSRDPQVVKKKYLESGNKYFDRGRYREASIMYRRALGADPKYGEAYYKLALTFLKLDQAANSVNPLRRAVELLPKGSKEANEAGLNLGEILLIAAESVDVDARSKPVLDEVQGLSREFLARDPKSYEGHKLTADYELAEGVKLFRRNQPVDGKAMILEAIAEYRKALQNRPAEPVAMLSLARALTVAGENAEAEQLFRAVLEKTPEAQSAYVALYRLYLSEKKDSEAEAILKKAVAAHPNEFTFRELLAAHYFSNGNRAEGVKVLDQMKADFKIFPKAYLTAGDFYLRLRDTGNAIKQYEEGEQKDKPHKIQYQNAIIAVLNQQGKTAQAYELNLQILKEDPKNPEARGLKATFLLDKGDINQAINELQAVVTARPDNPVARFQLGRAHYAKQEYEQARQQFEKAVALRTDYLPPRLALAQVALARGDNENAMKLANEALKLSPGSGSAKLLQSAALMRLGDFKDARASLDSILAINPKQPDTLLETGVLNLMEKKFQEAGQEFHKAYEADPTNARGLLGEAESWLLLGKPDQAVKVIQDEVNRFPGRNDLKRDLGDIQFRTGHIDSAIQTYRDLTPAYKDNPRMQGDLYARVGDGFIRKRDFPQAIAELRKAHQLEPDAVPVINSLALLLENGGNHQEARKLYEESISRKQDDPEALNNLAYLMAETGGNLDEALTLATRAKQKLPNYLEISDTIGWIYLKKNLSDNAVDIFRDLTAKVPQNPTYHYHYAMALSQKGDKSNAQKQCEAALAAKPGKEEEGRIRELMAKI